MADLPKINAPSVLQNVRFCMSVPLTKLSGEKDRCAGTGRKRFGSIAAMRQSERDDLCCNFSRHNGL